MKEGEVTKVDIEQVLKSRCPGLMRFIPNGIVERLKRLICQDDLNRLLEENAGKEGADFCRGVLESLDVQVDVMHAGRLPDRANRRVVFVSNHPLGGLDGMALIDFVQSHYGGQVWFVVNDLLMAVKPLGNVFLPINKFGKQSRAASAKLEAAFAGNDPIIIFPAGLVSRYRKVIHGEHRKKMVCDLDWNKMFVTKSAMYKRDIVPLFFEAANSMDFYKKANLRKRLGIKFNIEQILLPREIFRSRGKRFVIKVGNPIPWKSIRSGAEARGYAESIKIAVYMMMADSEASDDAGGSIGE